MTHQTTTMNSFTNSTYAGLQGTWIASVVEDLGLRFAIASHRILTMLATVAPAMTGSAAKSPARTKSPPLAMAVAERVAAPARAAGAGDTLPRFQRDIVPLLDAAYNFARFLSRDADAAQDIVQEAFLRAYRSFDGYQGGDARAWIFAIVRNCYHNWLLERRRKASHEIELHGKDDADENPIENVPSDEDSPETTLLRRAQSGAVRLVLGKLPRPLREILVLRELEGLSYRQIAEIAALPIGTVMSRLARARTHFENAWRQETDREQAN